MGTWYEHTTDNDGTAVVTFLPSPDRFWPPGVLRRQPLAVPAVPGRPVTLTGAGALWMYAHAAATLRAAGAGEIRVRTPRPPGTSDDLEGSEAQLVAPAASPEQAAFLSVRLRASPPLSPAAIDRLLDRPLEELARLRPRELAVGGRASAEVYVRAARAAVDAGVGRVTCWSARDGLVVIHDVEGAGIGDQIALPGWLARAMPRPAQPLIVGVVGDPNRGKSVFSTALDWYRERVGCDGWKLDCDGQSPTSPWYLSLVGRAPDADVGRLREVHKRPWTPEMEAGIAEQLRRARELFPVLIADLPGGNHKVVPAQRVPGGRERIFAETDALVLLDGNAPVEEAAWREALRPHGLDGRIAAVLTSRDPEGLPSLAVWEDGGVWRGEVTGLSRSGSPGTLGGALRSGLDKLWPALLAFARRRHSAG